MKGKLLIVDDDKIFAECLKEYLDSMSDIFETDISFSISDAILKIDEKAYDLVITDIKFPGKSGIDLLLYLKEIQFTGSLKVITGYGETGIIFLVCQNDKKSHFYTALFLKEDGNITVAKKKLQEVVEALKPELSST